MGYKVYIAIMLWRLGIRKILPSGYAVQWTAWDDNLASKRKEFPNVTISDVMRIARMTSADPTRGGFGPHQTGGAIDLTLMQNGKELDMGTPFAYHGIECQTDYKKLTPQQRKNRDLLRCVLHDAGLINYPGEWWHYSYGDRAWAVYGHKPFAIYGRVDNPDYKLKPSEEKYAKK